MQNGFIDSTLERSRVGLQAERQRFRRTGYENGSTGLSQLNFTRLLATDAKQGHASLSLGVKGSGALIARDLYQVRGEDRYDNVNRYHEGTFLARQIGKGAVDLCLGQSNYQAISSVNSIKTARGDYSALIGGHDNNISSPNATYSALVGGYNCTISSSYSGMLGGTNCVINGGYSGSVGGASVGVYGNYGVGLGGINNQLYSQCSVTLGGTQLQTYVNGEVAHGYVYRFNSSKSNGSLIHLGGLSGSNSSNGYCNLSTNEANYNNGSEGSENILYIRDYSTIVFEGTLLGRATGSSACIAYSIKLAARKTSNQHSSTAILGTPVVDTLYSESADAWTLSITAYTTNTSGVRFTVNTGSTDVRWSLTGTVNHLVLQ